MSKNRFIRLVALAGCSVLIGAFGYTPAATAHIGSSHAPFTTTHPDIRTATITSGNSARVCFDEAIGAITDHTAFQAEGYDSNLSADGEDAALDINNTSCVLVDFEHPQLEEATIVTVEEGAVDDLGGFTNTHGAVTLTGSTFNARSELATPGNTAAPEVVSTSVNDQDNEIDYTFDKELDEESGGGTGDPCDEEDFGFHTGDGTANTGDDCSVDGNTVTVEFTPDVTSAVRFFVETAGHCSSRAIFDLGTLDAPADVNEEAKFATAYGAPLGNNTADPDLVSVTRAGSSALAFAFDEGVVLDREECFKAFSEDGTVYSGDSFTLSGNTVTVTFTGIAGAPQEIVRAAVAPGGVCDTTGGCGDPNTWGHSALSASGTASGSEIPATMQPGYSDGGDLEQATADTTNDRMRYCFDIHERLRQDPTDADAGDFFVYDSGATLNSGVSVFEIDENCISINFSAGDVDLAVAAGLDSPSGVRDRLEFDTGANADICNEVGGTCNSEGNRALTVVAVATGGPPPTGVAPPPGPPAPPGPPGPPPGTPPTVTTGLCDANRATAPVAEILIGTPGPDCIKGFGGDDTIRGRNGADTMGGGPGDDVIAGQRGKDAGRGGAGNDTIRGGPGNDNLRGGSGDDTMAGSKGNDTLRGGKGDDLARGGKGRKDLCKAETERGCEN